MKRERKKEGWTGYVDEGKVEKKEERLIEKERKQKDRSTSSVLYDIPILTSRQHLKKLSQNIFFLT